MVSWAYFRSERLEILVAFLCVLITQKIKNKKKDCIQTYFCGRLPMPGEEMGSGCYIEVLRQQTGTHGGKRRREAINIQKRLRQVGREGIE